MSRLRSMKDPFDLNLCDLANTNVRLTGSPETQR